MYTHKIIRFNYTTYDMRRDQDIVNPKTCHSNVMTLASEEMESEEHPFLYCHVLGIFHVNVVYNGPGRTDYTPRRLDFLWVRWYDLLEPSAYRGKISPYQLDHLTFPPVTDEGAFGFLNPADVLRSCHIIPAFALGRKFEGGEGLSCIAKDSKDWKSYYVSR